MMAERDLDRFLRARRVAVLSMPREGKAPLTTPIWYDWDGSRFRLQVEVTSAKAKLLARRGPLPASLTIQSEVPPYRYAVAYGTARLRDNDAGLRDVVSRRYFGSVAGKMYVQQETEAGRTEEQLRVIEIVPDRFVTHDFHAEAGLSGRAWFALWRWFNPVPA